MRSHAWNDRLNLGREPLDAEHHLQVAMVSALAEAIEQGRPWMAKRLAEQLAGYTAAHFTSEQLLMETTGYAKRDEHGQEHRSLLTHIDEIRYLLGGGEYELALPMSLDLLTGLGSHIAASDRAFAEHAEATTRRASR
jgi:hemerythrin